MIATETIKTTHFVGDISEEYRDLLLADGEVGVDTETRGLKPIRDKLCLVQIGRPNGEVVFTKMTDYECPNLNQVIASPELKKIFHYARFDIAFIGRWMNVPVNNYFCTKIASKLVRTYSAHHGLKDLVQEYCGQTLNKTIATTDWARAELTQEQWEYAAKDVLYLHQIKEKLVRELETHKMLGAAEELFWVIGTLAKLDVMGYEGVLDF
jgi:ribonuclease D